MQFVNPVFLYGLSAILIPIIIHLFNFRRFRKVYFTNVRFLQELKQETRKRSQLRHLIILALRILAIAALVMAFAQPYIPFSKEKAPIAGRNAVSIFVDNSFSMEAVGSAGSLLDEAKQKAREVVSAYRSSDQFQLLTNDFEGRHQHFLTRDDFLTMLEEVKPGPVSRDPSEIISRQADLLNGNTTSKKTSFIVSDFQASVYQPLPVLKDTSLSVFFVPLNANKVGNIYVDSCWFDLPLQQLGQTAVINCRIYNKSGIDLEKVPVRLLLNHVQRAVASVDIKAGASEVIKIPFTNSREGLQQGVIEVTDYPITYDDKFYFSFEVTSSIRVLSINGKAENKFLVSLFSQDSTVRLVNLRENALDYGNLSSFNLIILNELPAISSGLAMELKRFVENGGTIAIFPASLPDLVTYNAFLSGINCPLYQTLDTSDARVVSLNMESHIFRDVFEKETGNGKGLPENTELPAVTSSFPIIAASTMQTQPMMKMINGRDFLLRSSFAKGQAYQFAIPLDPGFTNFPRQALFVPVIYNIALDSRPPQQLYYAAGLSESILVQHDVPAGDQVFKLKAIEGDFEIIPEHQRSGSSTRINPNGEIDVAGNYFLLSGIDTITYLSFNYDRRESDPLCLQKDQLKELTEQPGIGNYTLMETTHKPLNDLLKEMNFGKQLWKYFIWFVLICLLSEVLLLRIWKY